MSILTRSRAGLGLLRPPSDHDDTVWTQARCVFVLSTGRCGTVTIVRLLDLSPDVQALHEPKPHLLRVYRRAYAQASTRRERYIRLFQRARRHLIAPAHEQGHLYAEATLLKFFAHAIAECMPRARFLFLHRHPGDVVRSGMRRRWYQGNALDPYKLRPLADDPARRDWPRWSAFERICWLWHAENLQFLRFARSLGHDRVMTLSFDRWIRPETGVWRDVFAFIDAAGPSEEDASSVLSVRHNEQTRGEFPRFCDWSPRQVERLHDIAGPTMQRLGYL